MEWDYALYISVSRVMCCITRMDLDYVLYISGGGMCVYILAE